MPTLPEAAAEYRRRGMHPFPCVPRTKTPLVKWAAYQQAPPAVEQVAAWWKQWPEANIALAMGRGTMAVDLDGPDAEELLYEQGVTLPDAAPRVETSKGWHVYLSVSVHTPNSVKLFKRGDTGVDIRGDGGYVMAPPSVHETGSVYRWAEQGTWPPPPASDRLMAFVLKAAQETLASRPSQPIDRTHDWISTALQGVGEGQRNDICAKLAGYLLRRLPPDVTRAILLGYAARCRPPMLEREVGITIESVRKKSGAIAPDPDAGDGPLVAHISTALDAMRAEMLLGDRPYVKTPFPGLNNFLVGGFGPGELVMIGARPAVGKTALALELAREAAKHGKRVLFVSREMPMAALARRMMAQAGEIRASALKLGTVVDAVVERVAALLRSLPIWLSDAAVSIQDVHAAVEAMPEPVDYLIVDYLQLVRAPREIRDRRLQVEHVSQSLKDLAMRRKIPVVCLSSLSRPVAGQNTRPTLASLRDSGELEHDSSVVLLLHVPDEQKPERECIVAKGREGRTGVVMLKFDAEFVSFEELADESRFGGAEYPESEARYGQ